MNFLAINVAHDLASGRIDAEEARRQYTETAKAFHGGQRSPYTRGLQFDVSQGGTADKDEITIPETVLHKIGETLGMTD
jgi:hypothetical protein